MKSYSTLLLSTMLLLSSLTQVSKVAAQDIHSDVRQHSTYSTQSISIGTETQKDVAKDSTLFSPHSSGQILSIESTEESQVTSFSNGNPTIPNEPMQIRQDNATLSIFYKRSPLQKDYTIRYAVWSTENGKDDIKWYTAQDYQTDIDIRQHTANGSITIESYILLDQELLLLENKQVTIQPLQPTIQGILSEPGYIDVIVHHIPSTVAEVLLPTWSEQGGQDDIKWYKMNRQTDGTYRLRIDLRQHQNTAGLYHLHLYTKSGGQLTGAGGTSIQIKEEHLLPTTKPVAHLKQINSNQFEIRVENLPTTTTHVLLPTWSEQGGQDDIKWYTATRQQDGSYRYLVSINNHKQNKGIYHTHVYIKEQSGVQMRYIVGGKLQMNETKPRINASADSEYLNISLENIPTQLSEILLPTWSEQNGQDDIKWYPVKPDGNGNAHLRIPLKNHSFDTGIYHLHLYGKEAGQNSLFNLAANSINIASTSHSPLPSPQPQEPVIQIRHIDAQNGTYQINVNPSTATKPIQKVEIATWSTANQSNIKWRTAIGNQTNYTATIDFTEHQSLKGIYFNHVYITYTDGSRKGYIAQEVDLSKAVPPVKVDVQLPNQQIVITIQHARSTKPVQVAIWSDQHGQDDIKWYTATMNNQQAFQIHAPLSNHKGSGLYHIHIYQEQTAIKTQTIQVTNRPVLATPNTYPVGQCTWGAKQLAPWVGNNWGHAKNWIQSARQAGFTIGSTPRVGAVVVWPDDPYSGGYGHVAVVTAVESSVRIRVSESNYAGNQTIKDYRGWFNPTSGFGRVVYIYP